MAVTFTVTPVKTVSVGDRKMVVADVACTGTPTVGGDALTGTVLGLELELDAVLTDAATVSGGTSGAAVAAYHGTAGSIGSSVNILFYVQGTAGAANSQVAYSGATAGFIFRVVAFGKGKGI